MQAIFRFLFRLSGWKIQGAFPDLKKYVIIVAPHTSNWDFIVGLQARAKLRMQKARYLGKDSLFKPPFGWIFYKLGGYPVDRSSRQNIVEKVVEIFEKHDSFILTLAPEGTRSKVEKLRTGFWYIAHEANVPIVPCGFDYPTKTVVIGEVHHTTVIDDDMKAFLSFFSNLRGKRKELGINAPE